MSEDKFKNFDKKFLRKIYGPREVVREEEQK
jgi:hypothetical protein